MRYKILKVHNFIFIEMCKLGTEKVRIIKDALPEDTKYVRCYTNDDSGWGAIYLVIESQTFDELKEGDPIPLIPGPIFERVE